MRSLSSKERELIDKSRLLQQHEAVINRKQEELSIIEKEWEERANAERDSLQAVRE